MDDAAELIAEAEALVLARFAEAEALMLGRELVAIAEAEGLGVVIDIRTADRTLFHAALPGAAPLNDLWARRKSTTALIFQKSSLAVGREMRAKGQDLAMHGLSPAECAVHGGAVPIRVAGVGVVAVATVSGLPDVADHALVLRGLRALGALAGRAQV
jgi:uncharacterized protein (UPF0303 family)